MVEAPKQRLANRCLIYPPLAEIASSRPSPSQHKQNVPANQTSTRSRFQLCILLRLDGVRSPDGLNQFFVAAVHHRSPLRFPHYRLVSPVCSGYTIVCSGYIIYLQWLHLLDQSEMKTKDYECSCPVWICMLFEIFVE
ncbi:uncharacterized protein [Gossypium hirsutum]|uniref:Uncharacterized protein n=1 Tax=Gossypium hirsutum TaxID=3635 RepID=A0ABM2YVN3_GOSHI|nr:uncharacterized protein LOC121208134 [Gossypium hirsutum]